MGVVSFYGATPNDISKLEIPVRGIWKFVVPFFLPLWSVKTECLPNSNGVPTQFKRSTYPFFYEWLPKKTGSQQVEWNGRKSNSANAYVCMYVIY